MKVSDIIASFAGAISIVSLFWTWSTRRKLDKQQLQINEQQLAKSKEENEVKKKANVQAKAYKKAKMWAISIRNTGQATAKNLRLSSPNIENETSGIVLLPEKGLLPYPILHPNEEFEISVLLHSGHIPTPQITLIWDDDFAKDNKKEQILQF